MNFRREEELQKSLGCFLLLEDSISIFVQGGVLSMYNYISLNKCIISKYINIACLARDKLFEIRTFLKFDSFYHVFLRCDTRWRFNILQLDLQNLIGLEFSRMSENKNKQLKKR